MNSSWTHIQILNPIRAFLSLFIYLLLFPTLWIYSENTRKWLWQFVFVYYCVLFISTEETMKEAVVWPLKKQRLVQPHLKVHLVAAFNLITFIIISRGRLPSLPVWYYSNVECNILSIHGTFSVTTILWCLWTCVFIDSDRQVNIKQTRAVWSSLSPTPRTQRWRKKEK